MTTRPTDEEISVLIDEVTIYAALAACATSENERASHRNRIEKAKLQLRDAWLAERQAARDGVTDEMVDKALDMMYEQDWRTTTPDILRKNMRAALQSITPPITSVSDALNFLEEWALAGNQLHGDDIQQFHATAERIAPIALAAAGFKSPDIRERTYWCATHSNCEGLSRGDGNGESGTAKVPSSWGELARVHAEGRWAAWVSESGAGPIIDGIPGRVGQVRAYGNAIKPFIAAEFITAYMQARGLIGDQQEVA